MWEVGKLVSCNVKFRKRSQISDRFRNKLEIIIPCNQLFVKSCLLQSDKTVRFDSVNNSMGSDVR